MMPDTHTVDVARLVEPDRVHRHCYSDADVFEAEIREIFHKSWIYIGHESQVREPGEYWTTQIGRQPMILIRGADGGVHVLFNRCPHRGTMLCSERHGNVGEHLRCTYHAWEFNHDGSLHHIPVMSARRPVARSRYGQRVHGCALW